MAHRRGNLLAARPDILEQHRPAVAIDAEGLTCQVEIDVAGNGRMLDETTPLLLDLSGEGSADSARLQNNLASLHEDRGDYVSAEVLYRASLNSRISHLGPQHGLVARAQHNLARVLIKQGRHAEAGPLLQSAMNTRRQTFGEDDAQTLGSRALQAWWLANTGNATQASVEIGAVIGALPLLNAEDPLLRVFVYRSEAQIALSAAEPAMAIAALSRADAVLAQHWDDAHPLRAELQLERARWQAPAERDRAQLRKAADVVRHELSAKHPVMDHLAELALSP